MYFLDTIALDKVFLPAVRVDWNDENEKKNKAKDHYVM